MQGLSIASWALASLIIVLRMQVHYSTARRPEKVLNVAPFRIAIWDRNIIVSSISLATWLASLGLNIRSAFRTPAFFTQHLTSSQYSSNDG
jgi:hypothetical protein